MALFLSFTPAQGHRQGRGTEQHSTVELENGHVHGSGHPLDAATEAKTIGPRTSRCAGSPGPWRQHGHLGVSAPVQESPVELFDEEFPARQEPLRQNS